MLRLRQSALSDRLKIKDNAGPTPRTGERLTDTPILGAGPASVTRLAGPRGGPAQDGADLTVPARSALRPELAFPHITCELAGVVARELKSLSPRSAPRWKEVTSRAAKAPGPLECASRSAGASLPPPPPRYTAFTQFSGRPAGWGRDHRPAGGSVVPSCQTPGGVLSPPLTL